MARYFAVNSLAGAFRTITAIVEATTASRFDSAYVASAISLPANSANDNIQIKQPFLDGSTSLTGTFYVRFDAWGTNFNNSGAPLMTNAGANAYRLQGAGSNTGQMQYWNSGTSAWVNWGSSFATSASTLMTLVVKLTPNVGYEIFLGGSSVASSAVVPTNGASAVDMFQFFPPNTTTVGYYSQIMCADYDLRDSHLMPATFNGNSATNTAGTGAYTDVNETVLDESTAIVIASAGKKGQTHAAITVPSGLGIAALIVNARGRVSGGTVTDGKLGVRSGGTNYSSAGKSYNGGYEPRGNIWESDPSTSAAWTQTSFNNAETYLEAV
jgi:hypothetical protein